MPSRPWSTSTCWAVSMWRGWPMRTCASQAFTPTPFQAHVCAAKAGVDMLTRVLALEWGAEGIRINSIVPGPIADTEGLKRLAPTPETLEAMAQLVPLKRLGRIDDIARMAMMLSSEW